METGRKTDQQLAAEPSECGGLGRIERSLFMLEWMKDPELRRRLQVGLNKGESRNALARAVFFNRQGDLRDRSFENQRYRASGLNLIVAAMILWNTVYLGTVSKLGRHTMGSTLWESFPPRILTG